MVASAAQALRPSFFFPSYGYRTYAYVAGLLSFIYHYTLLIMIPRFLVPLDTSSLRPFQDVHESIPHYTKKKNSIRLKNTSKAGTMPQPTKAHHLKCKAPCSVLGGWTPCSILRMHRGQTLERGRHSPWPPRRIGSFRRGAILPSFFQARGPESTCDDILLRFRGTPRPTLLLNMHGRNYLRGSNTYGEG
jgi:hypothetical protein